MRAATPPPAVRRPKAGARRLTPSRRMMRGDSEASQKPVKRPNRPDRIRNSGKESQPDLGETEAG